MPVVGGTVAVNRDANPHAVLSEQFAELFIKQDTVGVNPQIEAADTVQCSLELGDNPSQPGPASRGSPPCRTTCTPSSRCDLACSAMRSAVCEITSSEIAKGRPCQL